MTVAKVDPERLVAQISIFEGLAPEHRALVLELTRTRELRAGEILFRKGDPGNQLYAVMSGRLRVSGESEDGREVTFGTMEPGEVVGEIALLSQSARTATVEALEETALMCLHRGDFLPFLDAHPGVAVQLAAVLAERLRKLSKLLEDTLFTTLPSHLAMNLLALAKGAGGVSPEGISLDIHLPHTRLDELAGETPGRLKAVLREWEERGLVSVEHGVVTVRGLEGLETLARFLID